MILTRGKNNSKNQIILCNLGLGLQKFFRPFLIFLRSLMPKKSMYTGMQKSHIRVVFQRLWFFGHFWPIQITALDLGLTISVKWVSQLYRKNWPVIAQKAIFPIINLDFMRYFARKNSGDKHIINPKIRLVLWYT